jgi:small subunit ribosomal protein S6
VAVRKYELIMVIKPSAEDEAVAELVEKTKKFVTDHDGEVEVEDVWGLRRLAYPIQGFREGTYILTQFAMDGEHTSEMESMFKLQDDLLRHLLVKRDTRKKAEAKVEAKVEAVEQ